MDDELRLLLNNLAVLSSGLVIGSSALCPLKSRLDRRQ